MFEEERFFFGRQQLSETAVELIKPVIKDLGGQVVGKVEDASVVILNPSSPDYDVVMQNYVFFAEEKGMNIGFIPYQHIFKSRNRGEVIPVDADNLEKPLFVHPQTRDPLKIYVSLNVEHAVGAEPGQKPEVHQKQLQRRLEEYGALIVTKRLECDVGIFNLSSTGSQKFIKELKDMKKPVRGRQWAERCISTRHLEWLVRSNSEADSDDDDDEPDNQRPRIRIHITNGRPRTEFTAEDDENLCRWLGRHHPNGSWHSRKTYEGLVANVDFYPWAANHPYQSWHERFRKNSAAFTKRVQRFHDLRIDDDLLTSAERKKQRKGGEIRSRTGDNDGAQRSPKKARLASPEREGTAERDPSPAATAARHRQAEAGPGPSTMAASAATNSRASSSAALPTHAGKQPSAETPAFSSRPPADEQASSSAADPQSSTTHTVERQVSARPPTARDETANEDASIGASPAQMDKRPANSGPSLSANQVAAKRHAEEEIAAQQAMLADLQRHAADLNRRDVEAAPTMGGEGFADDVESVSLPVAQANRKRQRSLSADDAATEAALFTPVTTREALLSAEPMAMVAMPETAANPAEPRQLESAPHPAVQQLQASPERQRDQHIVLAVQQQSPDDRVRLSLSTQGNATVEIEVGGTATPDQRQRQRLVHTPRSAHHAKHPGSARKMLLAGTGATVEEIHSSGGSRRRSSIKPRPRSSLAHASTPDTVLRSTTTPIRVAFVAPEGAPSIAAPPAAPLLSTGTIDEGKQAAQALREKYKEWVRSMMSQYGVSANDVVVAGDRVRARNGSGSVRWAEVEAELASS